MEKKVAELTFIDRDTNEISIGGVNVSNSKDSGSVKEHNIDLSPEMNPVRFYASANYSLNKSSRSSTLKSEFELSIFEKGELLWTEPFAFSEAPSADNTKKIKNTSQGLKLFEIETPSTYTLKLKSIKPQDLNISNLSIGVRRNVTVANSKIYITGWILFLLGLGGIFLTKKKVKKKPEKVEEKISI